MKQQVRIVIADHDHIFCDGLKRLLEAEDDFKVLGEAVNDVEAVRLARELRPDILLLDRAMRKQTLRELIMPANSTGVRVILVTSSAKNSEIVEAFGLGAWGIVLKDSPTPLLLKAIQTVMKGEYWVDRERVSNLFEYLRPLMQSPHDEVSRKKVDLTSCELEILSAIEEGHSYRQIAEKFQISEDNVRYHVRNIFRRFGVSTRWGLASRSQSGFWEAVRRRISKMDTGEKVRKFVLLPAVVINAIVLIIEVIRIGWR